MSACLYLNSRNNNNICDPRRQGMQPVQHTHTLKKTTDLAMEKQRGEVFVTHDDGIKAREKLVAKAESSMATGTIVAQESPSAICHFSFFFFILLHGDGLSCRHFVAKKDGIFLFLFCCMAMGYVSRHVLAMFGFIFGFIF